LIRFARPILFILVVSLPQAAFSQQREIFDLFGGMVRSGIAAATQADWERLPGSEVACLDSLLRHDDSSVNAMIRQGVSPSDLRMSRLRSQCRQATASGPSFDCRRARSADEISICGDPELARLDQLIEHGYHDLVSRLGARAARSVTAPLLAARRACGADAGCIKTAQFSAIRQLQQRGVVIIGVDSTPVAASPAARPAMAEAIYMVEGLHLGDRVSLGSPSYLEYSCNPSDQFAGLTRCQKRRHETSPRGAYISTTTMIHANDGTAFYVNRFLEPAFFAGTEAMDDVRRLAVKYGDPRFIDPPAVLVGPRTLMATWGDVSLQPLERARLADLAVGRDVRAGILVDHIGNFQRSASTGLPVYRVTGGAGYVWAASWDRTGRGTLRFLTIDAAKLAASTPTTSQSADTSQEVASNQPSTPAIPSANEPREVTPSPPAAQPQPAPPLTPATPMAAAPSPQPENSKFEATPNPAAPPQPENAKPDSLAKPLPSPTASETIAPASSTKQPVVAQTVTPATPPLAETNRQAPQAPSADETVQPRVVGSSIAIQRTPNPPEPSYLQWALMAAVVMLIGAVGFLLFNRRKQSGALPNPNVAQAAAPIDFKEAEPSAMSPRDNKALHPEEPERDAPTMQDPALPIPLPQIAAASDTSDAGTPAPALQGSDVMRSSKISEHRHFGIGILMILVTLSALMSLAIGPVGLIPLGVAVYLLPTIIAFKVRHHYAWVLAILNVVFGVTGLAWLGFFVWALIGPRKSALDAMSQHSALDLAKAPTGDPALTISDYDLRSGWKMPVLQAEIFSFEGDGAPVESAESINVFFKNPVIGIWRTDPATSGTNSIRYNAATQVRCVAKIAAETKLRVGRTLGRTALTGIGAAILTGRRSALGAAMLDYRFAGNETDEMVAALIVFSDYSSIVLQSESAEFEKLCALLPAHLLSDEVQAQTAEEIDRIKRMAADGPRVIEEMKAQITETERSIAVFAEQAKSGDTFAERDEGRIGLSQAEERLINERAVLNAVDRLIRLAANRELPGRQIA
jgi:hypothetical protein